MPQNFKLRLGDGTELVVDHDGLRTWSVDEKAAVQTKKGWRSLKEVLAHLDRPPQPDDGVPVIALKPQDGRSRAPQAPPPSTGEIKALSFADAGDEEPSDEDEYVYEGPSALGVAWLWMKRLVLLSGLAVGGYFAATTWQTWLPKAGRFGEAVLGEIQKHTGSKPGAASASAGDRGQMRQAVESAAPELPHLNADAIELVMSSSLGGALEAPEVFRRAQEAADRGASALTPAEAQELKTLRAAVMAALPTVERARVHEYEQARAYRATLAFEDKAALGSYAQGARALPAASRDRLRALLGKAIAAALRTGPASDTGARAVAAR
jgi:hypothetical protein